ncbi:MAG TPA: 2-hydroxychromene-2-carboxylate isomerase, partial [Halioglobus sp.]
MAEQFQEQGGAATMDPSAFLRWATSKVITGLCKPKRLAKQRIRAEKKRIRSGLPHMLEYFHQVDDGYSQLAAQVLRALTERYEIQLHCHLVSGPLGKNAADPALLLQLSRYDAFHVAPEYGLEFPRHDGELRADLVRLACSILAHQDTHGFIARAAEVGRALWSDDADTLHKLAGQYGCAADSDIGDRIAAGTARRAALGHYSGAMFYYGGEWYWGVDRLYHLEQRFAELGIDRQRGAPMLVPRPGLEVGPLKDSGRLTLEVFPSLRSPYTAISFDRAVKLARDTGIDLVVRPVLPMVMRGVPATRQKGLYIFWDAAREAHAA